MRSKRITKNKEISTKPDMRTKLNEMEAFSEYAQNSWAYYYAYPEYFAPDKFPPDAGENSTLGQGNGKHIFSVDQTGQFCIYFCPAVAFLNRQQQLNPLFSILKGSSFMNQWMIPPEDSQEWVHGPRIKNIQNTRITGGYLKVSTVTNVKSGSLRHAQIKRSLTNIPALNLTYATFVAHNEPSQTFIVRYRHPKSHPKFSDDNNYVVYHLIHGTGFIPNTLIEVECDIAYETACINTMCRNDQSHVSVVSHPSEARDKARKLLENMPSELFTQPLTSPLKYRRLFDGDVSADKCFVEKNVASQFEGINIHNSLMVAQNTGGFSSFFPGQGQQTSWTSDVGNPTLQGGSGNPPPPPGGEGYPPRPHGGQGNPPRPPVGQGNQPQSQGNSGNLLVSGRSVGENKGHESGQQKRHGQIGDCGIQEEVMLGSNDQGHLYLDNSNVLVIEHPFYTTNNVAEDMNKTRSNSQSQFSTQNQPLKTSQPTMTTNMTKNYGDESNKESATDANESMIRAPSEHASVKQPINVSGEGYTMNKSLESYVPLIKNYVTASLDENPNLLQLSEEDFVDKLSSGYINTQFPIVAEQMKELLMVEVRKVVRTYYT